MSHAGQADRTTRLLVVIQGIDAAGKDSTVRHVMSGLNPQGVRVHSFEVSCDEELDHDFLWWYAARVPERGQVGISTARTTKGVIVVCVHPKLLTREKLPPVARDGDLWHRRFRAAPTELADARAQPEAEAPDG